MAEELDAGQVKMAVDYWERDAEHSVMRETMVDRWQLYSLLDEVELPTHMSRGTSTQANSPFIGWLTDAILSDVTGYPTYATVIPVAKNGRRATTEEQQQADKIERFCNLLLAQLDPGKTVQWGIRWHQLNSPYCVPILHSERDEDMNLRFRLELPASETCYFPIGTAPGRPDELARRYKTLLRTVKNTYANRRGTKHPGQRPYMKTDGTWDWEQVGDDYDSDVGYRGPRGASGKDDMTEVEVLVLYTKTHTYHLGLSLDGKDGELLYCEEHKTKGVPAVVIPGRVTELRGADRWWPMLYPIYQMVHLINRIRAKRETRSDQAKTDVLIGQDAEQIKAAAQAKATLKEAGLSDAQATELAEGDPSFITVPGDPVPWPLQEDRDLEANEQSYWAELKMYADSVRETTSAEEMANATANAYLSWSEQKKKQQAPMLDHYAFGMAEILRMALEIIEGYDEEYSLYAEDKIEYGGKTIEGGETVTLSPQDLTGFKYVLKVESKSMTETEIRMRVQDWAERNALGLSTKKEGIEAAGYPDTQAQLLALAIERAQDMATPFLEEEARVVIAERIRLRGRVLITMGAPAMAGGAGGGGGMQPMQPAALPSPVGSSAGVGAPGAPV